MSFTKLGASLPRVIPMRRYGARERAAPPSSPSASPSPTNPTSTTSAAPTAADDRTLCLNCSGSGCPVCAHNGHVCPACRGMRFVRVREWSTEHPWCGSEQHNVVRCDRCWESDHVNPAKEAAEIARYLHIRQQRSQANQTAVVE